MSNYSVPKGWKLVPVEPTAAMLGAAQTAWINDPLRRTTTLWSAMLAAAPAAPVARAEQEPVAWIRKNGFRFIAEIEPQDDSEVPLYAAPQPAEQQPAPDVAGPVEALRNMLSDNDIRHLRRFQEICEDTDADGHDLPKEAVRRLERAGALRSCGFGRHETTLFGDAILAALAGKGGAQ